MAVDAVAAPAPPSRAASARVWVRRLHVLLGVQSLLLVLASINRLTSVTDAAVLPQAMRRGPPRRRCAAATARSCWPTRR